MSEGKVKVRRNGTVMVTHHHHCHFQDEGHLVQGVNCTASFLKEEHSVDWSTTTLGMVANLFQVQSEFTVQSTMLGFSHRQLLPNCTDPSEVSLFYPAGCCHEKREFFVFFSKRYFSFLEES